MLLASGGGVPRERRHMADICGSGDGGLREAEFAQITRFAHFTHFDVTWPQGGKLGTLTGVLCPCGLQLILVPVKPRARVVSEEIKYCSSCSLPCACVIRGV